MSALLLLLALPVFAQRPPYSPERLAWVRDVSLSRLSPDGRELAFVTDTTGALELWKVPAAGGWPEQLSALGEQVIAVEWAPDGKSLLFASDFGGDERPDLYWVDAQGGEVENISKSTMAETAPRISPDGRQVAFSGDPETAFKFQIMVMDLKTRKVRQLTHETVNVYEPVWSPDNNTIAAFRTSDDHKGELLLINARTEEVRTLNPPIPGGSLMPEEFSGDGREVLCRAYNAKGFLQLYLLDLKTERGRFIGQDDWDVEQAAWHPAAGILYHRNEAGVSALYRLKTPDAKPEALLPSGGTLAGFHLDNKGRRLSYVWSDSRQPRDAWLFELDGLGKSRVTKSMIGGIKPEALSKGELYSYESFDERVIRAIVLRPTVKRLGSPPPAVVMVHGGPDWQSFEEFYPMRQALAEAGFLVIAPNYRGSTGFGKEFLELNRKDWGGADRKDLIWVVKQLAKEGGLDPKRVGIMGGSYGGYMTLYALAKNQGEWAAGVESYGMPDLVLDYEATKDRFADWYHAQMGSPKTDPELFRDRSAIHSLSDLKAPLLIFQGANDTNVPQAESELVYKKLKELGRPVEMTVYPDEGHGFTKRKNLIDHYKKTVDFFTRHIGVKR